MQIITSGIREAWKNIISRNVAQQNLGELANF